jgi:hypothetical protein
MLEEEDLLCHSAAIYKLSWINMQGQGPKGQSTELDQWTIEVVPLK